MQETTFTFTGESDVEVLVHRWLPDDGAKAVVQIAHGMQEHAGRYGLAAEALCAAGYAVYASDHRGHGGSGPDPKRPGRLGRLGYEGVLSDMHHVQRLAGEAHPGLPHFLLGHSWGSFLAQVYNQRWGRDLAGVILSGSNGRNPALGPGLVLARLVVAFRGLERQAGLLETLSVGGLNKPFEPGETGKEWLSRDEEAVRSYVADPLCAQSFPNQFFLEMLRLLKLAWSSEALEAVPKETPVYIFSGTEDPVSPGLKGLRVLIERYQKHGVSDVSHCFYEGGRHEMLNETNRDEVLADLTAWLDAHLPEKD